MSKSIGSLFTCNFRPPAPPAIMLRNDIHIYIYMYIYIYVYINAHI